MIDTSNKFVRGTAVCAVLVTSAVGMVLNSKYGYSLGSDQFTKYTFAAASVSIDVIKVTALGFAFYAFSKKHRIQGTILLMVWLVSAIWGVQSATGIVATERNIMVSEHVADNDDFKRDNDDYQAILLRHRELKSSEAWKDTQACLKPEGASKKVKQACDMYYQEISNVLPDLKTKTRGGSVKDSDAQATFLSNMLGRLGIKVDSKTMADIVILYFALLLEFIASVGMYGASKPRMKADRARHFVRAVTEVSVNEVKRRGRPPGSLNKPKLVSSN